MNTINVNGRNDCILALHPNQTHLKLLFFSISQASFHLNLKLKQDPQQFQSAMHLSLSLVLCRIVWVARIAKRCFTLFWCCLSPLWLPIRIPPRASLGRCYYLCDLHFVLMFVLWAQMQTVPGTKMVCRRNRWPSGPRGTWIGVYRGT